LYSKYGKSIKNGGADLISSRDLSEEKGERLTNGEFPIE